LLLSVTHIELILKKTEEKQEPTDDVDPREKILQTISSGEGRALLKPVPKQEKKIVSSVNKNKEIKRGRRETLAKKGVKEVYDESKGNFYWENLEGATKELDPERLLKGTVIQFSNCFGCTFKISKKVNKIVLANCEEVNVILDSLISNFEVINCVKVKIQVDGTVNAFSVDGSVDVVFYLSLNSKNAQFYTSKSSEVRVRLTKEDDNADYTEHLIPEQFVFNINANRKIESRVSDLYS